MDEIKKSYYAIIPANVRYDEDIPPNAKLLYGEITALCNEKGYCWAGNKYFSNLYSVSERSVKAWINKLIEKGYIEKTVIYKQNSKEVDKRILKIISLGGEKNFTGWGKNFHGGGEKIFTDNNTYINNTINKEKDISKDISKEKVSNQANELFEMLWKLYPNKKGKGQVSKTKKLVLVKYGYEQMARCIDRYLLELKKDDWRKPQNGSTFFNSGYVDYLDENWLEREPVKVKPDPKSEIQVKENEITDEEWLKLMKED